ncbi:hypothetical protein ABPG77_002124 [Micractinium sp. CCAP 211/92]
MLSATSTARATFAPSTAPPRLQRGGLRVMATANSTEQPCWKERTTKGAAAFFSAALIAGSASAITYDELQALSYKEVKGSGLSNQCPAIRDEVQDGVESLKPGQYLMDKFCMEPTSFKIKPVGSERFEPSTLLTRNTYSLDQMSGTFKLAANGNVELQEEDGIDFAPVTVKIQRGEMFPFLFTVKNLVASGPASGFTGEFDVASYRGATFMDPSGRGTAQGWDYQKGLQAAGAQEDLASENIKSAEPTRGQAAFAISKVDAVSGEVAGVFKTLQYTDDDLGTKQPGQVEVEGIWYARLN